MEVIITICWRRKYNELIFGGIAGDTFDRHSRSNTTYHHVHYCYKYTTSINIDLNYRCNR